ncbi:GAF domain-containing sensor histidine kinase [Baaleninema sp.]|uniref:GAF domain-containing sensor histidine kinase n=1 Tax=Baaleninema sp. TaxID=3101197 RepID=UPI003D08E04F
MWEIVRNIFSPTQYMPHGHCYLWQTPLVWLHVLSDTFIALAYFSIPAMLLYFVLQRRGVPFLNIFVMFGAFIVFCGVGHLFDVWTLWHPAYWLSGVERAATALVSCYTAGSMVTLLPRFLSLRTPEELEAINRKLQREIDRRRQTEEALQNILKGTASVTGEEFFPALVRHLSQAIDVPYALVSETVGNPTEKVRALASWQNGKLTTEVEYHLTGTPCGQVVRSRQCCDYPEGVAQRFPKDALLDRMKAQSYLGCPLLNVSGEVVGHLCAIDTRPRQDIDRTRRILEIFASRASAELERQRTREALEAMNRHLERRVEERTAEVSRSNQMLEAKAGELQQAIDRLQRTQSQLIQSEKMASLGQLVAGVAHELNNPVSFVYGNINYARDYSRDLFEVLEAYRHSYPHPTDAIAEVMDAVDVDYIQGVSAVCGGKCIAKYKYLENREPKPLKSREVSFSVTLNGEEPIQDDFPRLLDSMKTGAERIQKIVESLRNFSRLDEAECKPADVNAGLESTLEIVSGRLSATSQRRAIALVKNFGDLSEIECYPGLLNQAVLGLLNNAIEALEERLQEEPDFEPRLDVTTEAISDEVFGEAIAISIGDNGFGIEASIRDKIFDPFFTTKPVGRGTGMGLANAYQIAVDRHRGRLRCISETGNGTVFRLELPRSFSCNLEGEEPQKTEEREN